MSTTITNLPETSKVNGSDYLVLDQSDKTVKSTVSNFLADTGVVLATQLKDTDGADLIQSSNGNTVQEELNNNLLNDREQWRRSLAEAGLTLVDGSFEEGATVGSVTDAVWYIAGAQCYTWGSGFPKDVPPKSTPTSTGGVGTGAWVSVGDALLRGQLASSDGLKLIGQCESFSELQSVIPEYEGQRIFLKGWHSGSVLGSGWFMAESTTQADNGGTIAGSGSLKWVKIETDINSYTFGALPTDTDFLNPVQAAFDASAYTKYTVNFTEDHALPVSSSVTVKSGSKVKWSNNKAYITLTADSGYGGVIALLGGYGGNSGTCQDVYMENPRIDGGNIGHPTGDTQGQNGISGANFVKNVRIVGGHIKTVPGLVQLKCLNIQ